MCGIMGIVGKESTSRAAALAAGLLTLAKRGPDAHGIVDFPEATLGHTRLSIVDLTGGGQPMQDTSEDITITFNGEIYNYKELRATLEQAGHRFSTTSDTEVILKAYLAYGTDCPQSLDGMFAFAIWDNRSKRLFLARDRFGEKPLFYSRQGDVLLFASEIKALLKTGLVHPRLNRVALDNYLSLLYVPPWCSIYEDIQPLLPSHCATYENGTFTMQRYWKLRKQAIGDSFVDASLKVRGLIATSVASRMIADVEVGALLSGGIDSSIVTRLAQQHAARPLKTFSAGFETHINELPFALEVAKLAGTDHYEKQIDVNLLAELETITSYFDEPFADSSNIPTHLIAAFARTRVKVALTGDGGDELFLGYGQYRHYWHIPKVKKIITTLFSNTLELHKKDYLNYFSAEERKRLLIDTGAIEEDPTSHVDLSEAETNLEKINMIDISMGLPGDMLTKTDRASMLHSLELRSPFLNHTLATYAYNLPASYKTDRQRGKLLLEHAFGDLLPRDVFHRKKQGFGAPVSIWLQKPEFKQYVQELFKRELRLGEFLHQHEARAYVDAFYAGNTTLHYKVWILLSLEFWLRSHPFTKTR